jgi:flagellar motor switch protein FliM
LSGERGRQILTREEISALLSVVDRDEIAVDSEGDLASPPRHVVTYTFRKPNRVFRNQVKVLQGIHESFARLYSSALSTLLRRLMAEVMRENVEQTKSWKFVGSLAQRTCLAIFNTKPLNRAAAGREIPDDLHRAKASELLRRNVQGDHQR